MVLYKSNSLKVKDVDTTKGIVQAYYSAYGNLDSDEDIIMKGAATKSAKERGPTGTNRIKHFKNHRSTEVPGVPLELGEDEKGGWFISQLAQFNGEFTTLAKDTLIEYQSGVITEHSHGFEIEKSHTNDNGNQIITEIKLWEFSTLTSWGANPLTPVIGVKSMEDIVKALDKLNTLLKEGTFSDEYLKNVELNILTLNKTLKSLSANEPNLSLDTKEPIFDFDKLRTHLKN